MSWGETLNVSFELLKNELSKKGINSIEIFMNNIFKELFEKLHEKEIINEYKDLIDFENELEKLIQEKIKKSSEEIKKYEENIKNNNNDKTSAINLLNETYDKDLYDKKEYPCYEYFYYSDYLDEDYIMNKILKNNDIKKYPMVNKYLDYNMNCKIYYFDEVKKAFRVLNYNAFNDKLRPLPKIIPSNDPRKSI